MPRTLDADDLRVGGPVPDLCLRRSPGLPRGTLRRPHRASPRGRPGPLRTAGLKSTDDVRRQLAVDVPYAEVVARQGRVASGRLEDGLDQLYNSA